MVLACGSTLPKTPASGSAFQTKFDTLPIPISMHKDDFSGADHPVEVNTASVIGSGCYHSAPGQLRPVLGLGRCSGYCFSDLVPEMFYSVWVTKHVGPDTWYHILATIGPTTLHIARRCRGNMPSRKYNKRFALFKYQRIVTRFLVANTWYQLLGG